MRVSSCLCSAQTNSPPLRLIYSTTSKSSDDFICNDRWKVINGRWDACFCSWGECLHVWLAAAAQHAGVLHNACSSLEISHVDGNSFTLCKHRWWSSFYFCISHKKFWRVKNLEDEEELVTFATACLLQAAVWRFDRCLFAGVFCLLFNHICTTRKTKKKKRNVCFVNFHVV